MDFRMNLGHSSSNTTSNSSSSRSLVSICTICSESSSISIFGYLELVAGIENPQFQSQFWSRSNHPKLHSPEVRKLASTFNFTHWSEGCCHFCNST
ncbi:hypothetical protein OROHE_010444 [Orobanche hederae]